MTVDNIDPDFEADFLKQRIVELHRTHPAEAALIANILEAMDYEKTAIRNELQVRGMVVALGYTLAKKADGGLIGLNAWLRQFVKDGALTAERAAAFTAQAETIYA